MRTEELGHLEMIGAISYQLTKGITGGGHVLGL